MYYHNYLYIYIICIYMSYIYTINITYKIQEVAKDNN